MNSQEIQVLFAQTLVGDYESEEAWAAVSALRLDGSRLIFEHASEWCHSDDPLKRARAVAILCQLQRAPVANAPERRREWMFHDEAYSLIARMLDNEQNPEVLDSAISALGHLDNFKACALDPAVSRSS